MASLFAINTRGFNDKSKHSPVKYWLQSLFASYGFGCLLETRVPEANSTRIISNVFSAWNVITNYAYHRLGKIWIVHSPDISVMVLSMGPQFITCSIAIPHHQTFICTAVYASNFAADRSSLWDDLRSTYNVHVRSVVPWIVLGDFNEILSTTEHSRYSDFMISPYGMCQFQEMVLDCELHDLTHSGSFFTWWNHQETNPIGKKLDRVLVNDAWIRSFPGSFAKFETVGFSDHTRSWVQLTTDHVLRRQPFKFFHYLTLEPRFLEVVEASWMGELSQSSSALFLFHKKLKCLKFHLRALNKNRFGNISTRTKEALDTLTECQSKVLQDPSPFNIRQEKEASTSWHHYSQIEERFFAQKSRILWLANGDRNTAFFHNSVRARVARNSIKSIRSTTGDILDTQNAIASEAVSHFKQLLSPLPGRHAPLALNLY